MLSILIAGAAGAALVAMRSPVTGSLDKERPGDFSADHVCSSYASPTGSDDGTGSATHPFRTVQALVRSLSSGRTGCLRTGTYTGDVTLTRERTTLRSAPGQRATLSLGTLTVPAGARGVTVSNLDIVGGRQALTVRVVGDDFTLEHNDISNGNSGASCLLVGASDHRTSGGTIRANVIHNCGQRGSSLDHGVYAQNSSPAAGSATGLLIEGNIFFSIASYAVQLYPRAVGVVLRRNVIDGGGLSVRGGIVIDGPLAQDHRVEGNIIARTRTGAVVQRTGSGHVSRDNCLWANVRGIDGPGISSSGDRVDEECWLGADLWARTGKVAADEPCSCPARASQDCSTDREDALCRLLARPSEEVPR